MKNNWIEEIIDREENKKQCDIQGVVERYRVEAISRNKKHLHNEVVTGRDEAEDLYQDLLIKYYQTYTKIKMTEL